MSYSFIHLHLDCSIIIFKFIFRLKIQKLSFYVINIGKPFYFLFLELCIVEPFMIRKTRSNN